MSSVGHVAVVGLGDQLVQNLFRVHRELLPNVQQTRSGNDDPNFVPLVRLSVLDVRRGKHQPSNAIAQILDRYIRAESVWNCIRFGRLVHHFYCPQTPSNISTTRQSCKSYVTHLRRTSVHFFRRYVRFLTHGTACCFYAPGRCAVSPSDTLQDRPEQQQRRHQVHGTRSNLFHCYSPSVTSPQPGPENVPASVNGAPTLSDVAGVGTHPFSSSRGGVESPLVRSGEGRGRSGTVQRRHPDFLSGLEDKLEAGVAPGPRDSISPAKPELDETAAGNEGSLPAAALFAARNSNTFCAALPSLIQAPANSSSFINCTE
jgi:hypothetical protein